MRTQVTQLLALGKLSAEAEHTSDSLKILKNQDELVRELKKLKPATNEEACALITIFGEDDSFGLAWSVLHFIESAPDWPIHECVERVTPQIWKEQFQQRHLRAGHVESE